MKTKLSSRIGALLIDNIGIYALGLGMLMQVGLPKERALIVISFIFLAYAILMPTFCKGYQLGKYMLGMKIVTDTYDNPGFIKLAIRELSKMIYVIPFIGIGFILTSQFLMNKREDGKTLHDIIAGTRVIGV